MEILQAQFQHSTDCLTKDLRTSKCTLFQNISKNNLAEYRLLRKLVIFMKSNIYQFSFNLANPFQQKQNENDPYELFHDIFPYLKMKTATFAIFALSLIPFAIEIYTSSIIPYPHQNRQNLFLLLFAFCSKTIIFLRLGSEYESKLGLQYFLTIMIIVQLVDLIVVFLIQTSVSLFIFRNQSLFSIYILSIIDLNKFKEDEIVQFKNEEKPVVQNCDLLDLNDSIAKFKSKENSSFYFDSYTNRQFLNHHPSNQDRPKASHKRMMVKTTIKSSNLSNIIQQPFISQQEESFQSNIYKLILFHFIGFSCSSQAQFILLVLNEAILYSLIATKVIKKIFP